MDEGLDCGKPLVTGLDSTTLVRLYMIQRSIGPLNSEIRNKKFIDMFASAYSSHGNWQAYYEINSLLLVCIQKNIS